MIVVMLSFVLPALLSFVLFIIIVLSILIFPSIILNIIKRMHHAAAV